MGTEILVDAYGCDPTMLRSSDRLAALAGQLVEDLGLHPIREPLWHAFDGGGGITGLLLLAESHVAIHTFPEQRFAAVSVYCCSPRPDWSWDVRLRAGLGATDVCVRKIARGDRLEGAAPAQRAPVLS